MIKLENINKTYHNGSPLHVLKGINLEVGKGELVSIMGASGSGKSTLLNILGILDDYDTGSYYLAGRLIKGLSETQAAAARNNMIGYIFQSFNLISYKNAVENVALPLYYQGVPRRRRNALALEYLDMLGLRDWAEHMPNEMSGGQKQRVAIARALATNPRYLLCDEATSALDPNTTRSILELLREINKTLGVTIIVITHEMKVIDQICDRVAVIDKSCIAEEGRVADVFTSPKSDIARELGLPQERPVLEPTTGGRKVRIIINGENTQKPVISEMILACRVPDNVLFADTKTV